MKINESLFIDERLLEERFVRSSGPGGQNVNKVSTAVELRFELSAFDGFTASERARFLRIAGRRVTDDGIVVIKAERFRTQERNREDARQRLAELVREALVAPKPRIATKPSKSSRTKRLDSKTKRGVVKKLRRVSSNDD